MKTLLVVACAIVAAGCSSGSGQYDPPPVDACVNPSINCTLNLKLTSGAVSQCGGTDSLSFSGDNGQTSFSNLLGDMCTETDNGCNAHRICDGSVSGISVDQNITFNGKGGVSGTTVLTQGSTKCTYTVTGTGC